MVRQVLVVINRARRSFVAVLGTLTLYCVGPYGQAGMTKSVVAYRLLSITFFSVLQYCFPSCSCVVRGLWTSAIVRRVKY
jgi:hypothetical protein